MRREKFDQVLIKRFNRLYKKHGAIAIDYLLSSGVQVLYNNQRYINEQRHYQYAESCDGVALPFVTIKIERPAAEDKFDPEMVAEIKELLREHHLEVYEYGLSFFMEALLKLDREIVWESRSMEEIDDEADPYGSAEEDYHGDFYYQ